jgi:hypothetical protein
MPAAGDWYAQGSFWVAVASLSVAILVGWLTIVVTQQSGFPKRQIEYGFLAVAPLVQRVSGSSVQLKVLLNNAEVRDPHFAKLYFENPGKRDISSNLFDGGRALTFTLDAKLIQILGVASNQRNAEAFFTQNVVATENAIEIRPCLVRAGASYCLDLLLDGSPESGCESPLIDVATDLIDVRQKAAKAAANVIKISISLILVAFTAQAAIAWSFEGKSPLVDIPIFTVGAIGTIMLLIGGMRYVTSGWALESKAQVTSGAVIPASHLITDGVPTPRM